MTIAEILAELDGLKDFTNDHGKGVIETLKREVGKLTAPVPKPEPKAEPKPEPKPEVRPDPVAEPKAEPVKAVKPKVLKVKAASFKKWRTKKK